MENLQSYLSATWNVDNWQVLNRKLRRYLMDMDIRESGKRRIQHVRMDVPVMLAEQPESRYAPLVRWLNKQNLCFQILGSVRTDIFVQVFFNPATNQSVAELQID